MLSLTRLAKLSLLASSFMTAAIAAESTIAQAPVEQLKTQLQKQLNISVNSVSVSPVNGFYHVFTEQGLLYVSTDGKQLIHGKVYNIEAGIHDLTEAAYSDIRLDALAQYSDSALVYPAKDEKYQVSVFTDITCGYCRKLHSQIKEFNDLGITVKYYAFPRGGLNSNSSRDLDIIWCDKDPEAAMTAAKRSGKVAGQGCAESPVASHYKLGASFGVGTTPSLVFSDGSLIPGYKPPEQLLALLQSKKSHQ